jgi:F420-dependent oxidoreductase-like protein
MRPSDPPVKLSFKVWPQDIGWTQLRDIWIDADAAGVYGGGWLNDHFYPPRPGQRGALFEAWTLLASLAAVTERLRLGTMVTSNTFRHPSLLAKMAITIDHVSAGRLDVGLGAGWHEEEHTAFGIEFPPAAVRWERLDETCAILDGLMTQDAFSFAGSHFTLVDAEPRLRPVQKPRPPIVIGGIGPRRTLPLVAKWADHWNWYERGATAEDFAARLSMLHAHCDAIGRDRAAIEVSAIVLFTGDVAETVDDALGFVAAGADHIQLSFRTPVDPKAVAEGGEQLAARL